MASTFGKVRECKPYNEYYEIKNAKSMCCSAKNTYLNCESNLLVFNKLKWNRTKLIPFSKTNLVAGLYSQEDLKYARTIANVSNNEYYTNIISPLSAFTPFYDQYVIDPNGSLFGKTPCGIDNYLHFVRLGDSS
jgi:hypothetical protein